MRKCIKLYEFFIIMQAEHSFLTKRLVCQQRKKTAQPKPYRLMKICLVRNSILPGQIQSALFVGT